mmetsp:Transcript_96336/g.276615  ORF Transcript_96336/g.276615 Transcript_96336/m.276615 type:complete len:232 (+) Transcript_96336:1147-1842(+)
MLGQELDVELQMVLQVFANLWGVMSHVDAELLQLCRISNATEHQQLWGAHCSCTKDDLGIRESLVNSPAGVRELHAHHSFAVAAVEQEPPDVPTRQNCEPFGRPLILLAACLQQRPEVAMRSAGPFSLLVDGHVHWPEALLHEAVHVLRVGIPRLHARLHEGIVDGLDYPTSLSADRQGPVVAPVGRSFPRVALRLLEVRKHMLVVPMRAPDLIGPPFEIQGVPTDVCHGI